MHKLCGLNESPIRKEAENKMDKELIEKAKQAKTPEELYEMAKEVGRAMTEESAKEYFDMLHPKTGELGDDELAKTVSDTLKAMNEDGTVKTDVGVLIKVKQISCYGNDSYGGMSGRDIMALACGLYESCDFGYMHDRVQQCEYLAQGFYKAGVKGVVLPAGGHAVYINMDEFFDGKRDHTTFAGTGFSLELIRRYGIRVSELGDFSMEYDLKTPEQQAELANVVRFAIDRSRLTQEHLDYVIAAVKALYEDRESIPNMRIVWGHKLPMRHFHAFLEPYANEEK